MSVSPGNPDDPTVDLKPQDPRAARDVVRADIDADEVKGVFAGGVRSGESIGPYRLLERIGEGGFGEVWLAERRDPMVQRVAIKVIKPGMDSRAVVGRFEQERQALAVMNHPNVARVLDGGITAHGRPYFVMEFVKGDAITDFCDKQRLGLRARLELFVPVCEALQHAHMKGIIHRDIKPSNILVAPGEGSAAPTVKVIDFGVAKAMSSPLTETTIHTERGQMIGTPEYMSPEQAEMGATDIDTRSDVYSLGVVLYELLSGTLPFEPQALRTVGYAGMQRILVESEPPKPSVRIASVDPAAASAISRARQSERGRIALELRSELEWIPLKAMRKDRTRRYPSAEALAADVRRYLAGQPLEAAPESRAYLFRKFVRRNRVQVSAAAFVVLALVAGLATTLWQARVAARERDAAEEAREAERRRADELAQVSEFQSEMLGAISTAATGAALMKDVRERFDKALAKDGFPDAERAERTGQFGEMLVRVNATDAAAAMIDRTILGPAVKALEEKFANQPEVDARLRSTIADLYRKIGLYEQSLALHQEALAARRRALGDAHRETLRSVGAVGSILAALGRYADAEPYYREALETSRRALGDEDRETIEAILGMGYLFRQQGKAAEAESHYRDALERGRRVFGEDARESLIPLGNLASLVASKGDIAEAESLHRENLERRRRVFGEEHVETVIAINNYAGFLFNQRRHAEAEPFRREALEKFRRMYGDEHPDTLSALGSMGSLMVALKRPLEAEACLREALGAQLRVLGGSHQNTLITALSLAFLLRSEGKHQDAVDLATRFEPSARKVFIGSNRIMLAGLLTSLGRARVGLGFDAERFRLAEENLLEAHPVFLQAFGEKHNNTLGAVEGLADLYGAWAAARPGVGFEEKASEWRARLEAGRAKPAG